MNNQEIQTLQQSFNLVEPIADTAASLFYGRLFELDPSLQPLVTIKVMVSISPRERIAERYINRHRANH
jgi:hypothetical protein